LELVKNLSSIIVCVNGPVPPFIYFVEELKKS